MYLKLVCFFLACTIALASDYGITSQKPGKSCRDIYLKNFGSHGKSGYYFIYTDKSHVVYCDMGIKCGKTGGWMKLVDVDAAKGCPTGWGRVTNPTTGCRKSSDSSPCSSIYGHTYGVGYSAVCGMAVGIQKGSTDAFAGSPYRSINSAYLDGVSITYGYPRKHVWSYGIGYSDTGNFGSNCPCATRHGDSPMSFVGNHYYCESATISGPSSFANFYTSNPLWDGRGCIGHSSCCNNPFLPWFYRQLPATTSDIEARICYDQSWADEGVLVKSLELYVQ